MSATSSELVKWLQEQETEGTKHSSGGFTLDKSKAWEKLGAFQLPFESAWVLKLVQASNVRSEAVISVQMTRAETFFWIQGVDDWNRATVEKAIFDLEAEVGEDLRHLAVAIRALAQLKSRPFSLEYSDGEHQAWTGTEFTALPKKEVDKNFPGFCLTVANFEFGESRSFFSLDNIDARKFRDELRAALASHCHFGPQNILVDGDVATSFLQDPKFGVSDHSRPLLFLEAPENRSLPVLHIQEEQDWEVAELGKHSVSVREDVRQYVDLSGPCSVAGLLSVFVRRRKVRRDVYYYEADSGRSQILWLKDGVVVDREPLPLKGAVGVGVVVSADGLETDLTGLTPRDGAAKDARRRKSLEVFHETLLDFEKRLGSTGVDVSHSSFKTIAAGALGVVCMIFIPIIGISILSKAGYEYSSASRHDTYLDRAFDDGLESLIKDFGDMLKE